MPIPAADLAVNLASFQEMTSTHVIHQPEADTAWDLELGI